MIEVLGTSWQVFIGITMVLMGFTSWMAGQALARTWRPIWQVFPSCLLLGLADRFLTWGLFEPDRSAVLWLISGYLIDTAVLMVYALLAYRLTKVRKMVNQYPWIYEQAGPFAWREKPGGREP